ncbi:MAG: hypothetical protein EOM74_05615 [Methanomicrobia archaeon]|nr:hypothetical protein [Methanomicrobia archaeon]
MANPNLKQNKLIRAFLVPFRGLVKKVAPVSYVKFQYRYITHHRLDLHNPIRYTAKLQYLRLFVYPQDLQVIACAGRATVREYITELGLGSYLIPIAGIYPNFDAIDFSVLPERFVMKATHACAFNYICLDKKKIDMPTLKKRFDRYLKADYGMKFYEPHYSKIKPEIIIEHYIGEDEFLPVEYKIHVFNGKAKYLYVVTGRGRDIRYNNYYIDWTPFDGAQFNRWKKTDTPMKRPENFDEMIKLAEKLAQPFPFVRVDLYDVNGKIYFGEMTFTPAKGTLIFDDDQADFEIGSWLDISHFLKKK